MLEQDCLYLSEESFEHVAILCRRKASQVARSWALGLRSATVATFGLHVRRVGAMQREPANCDNTLASVS